VNGFDTAARLRPERHYSFDQDDGWRIGTAQGTVRAAQLVIATNMTVKSPVGYVN